MAEARAGVPTWFEPRSWGERRQLLVHLLRNAPAPVYLRAPAAAGKTRFLEHLLEFAEDDFVVVRLNAAATPDVVGAVAAAVPGPAGQAGLGAVLANAPRPVMIAIDDADRLAESAGSGVAALARAGAHLLLVGRGGPPWLVADERLQVVDLPPFTPEEGRDFALALDPGQGRRLARDGGVTLYAATDGLPGRIRERMAAGGAGAPARAAASLVFWLGGGALAALVAVVLWQQDAINAWFDTAGPPVPAQAVREPAPPRTPPVEAPPVSPQAAASAPEPPVEPLVIADIEELTRQPGSPGEVDPPPVPEESPSVPLAPDSSAPPDRSAAEPPAPELPPEAQPEAREPPSEPLARSGEVDPGSSVPPDRSAAQSTAPESPAPELPPAAEPGSQEPPPSPQSAPESARDRLLGPEWLWAQPPQHFTLQLVGARDTTAIRKFVARHGLEGSLAVFERELAGRPWFSLLYGSFASREAAERQRARLPAPVRKDVWIRPFGDIRQYLGPDR